MSSANALSQADEVRTFPSITQKTVIEGLKSFKEPTPRVESFSSLVALPGILSTQKSVLVDHNELDDSHTYVGFNPTNLKLDVKTQGSSDKPAPPPKPTLPKMSMMNVRLFIPETMPTYDHGEALKKLKFKNDPTVDELRSYVSLMDKFSLHNFIIYEGRSLKDTPEFQSFQRAYMEQWGSVAALIRQLEEIMVQYEVKLAIVNGPKLFNLASLHAPTISRDELLSCVSNAEQIRPKISDASAGGVHAVLRAAIRIQAWIRLFIQQRRYKKTIQRIACAIRVQSHMRLLLHRIRTRHALQDGRSQQDKQWKANREKISTWWQSSPTEAVSVRPRLIIFIPSISVSEYMRLGMENLPALQNAHLSCLYQLADPSVHMIYVSPTVMSGNELAYHDRFLSLLGISTLPKRLHFVVPELLSALPQHLTVAQLLWASSLALKKIRVQIKRIPNAVIVPGSVGWAEKRIAHFLNVPMLSPEPTVCESISSRSAAKRIFMDSSVNIPVGAHDIFSFEDALIALSRLITSNMDVKRWLFRLNGDFNCSSTAYLDIDKISLMSNLRQEMEMLISMNQNSIAAWFTRPVQLNSRKRLLIALRAEVAAKVVICNKEGFPSWEQFLKQARLYGMVIEAAPLEPLGYVDSLCFIDPLGGVQLVGGVDVLVDTSYQSQATVWPQSVTPQTALDGATEAIAQTLYSKYDAIGFVTVRFQSFWDAYDKIPRLWAMGLQFGMTPTFGSLGTTAIACNPTATLPKSLLPTMPEDKSSVHVPIAVHDVLRGSRDDTFFKFCRMRGIAFDVSTRTGTLFFLVDSIVGGVISLACVGNGRLKASQAAVHSVEFVWKQFGKDSLEGPRPCDNLQSILIRLKKSLKRDLQHDG